MTSQILLMPDEIKTSSQGINLGQLYSVFNVKNCKFNFKKTAKVEEIKSFIEEQTPKSIELEEQFEQIKEKRWDNPMVIVNELGVQLGQLYSMNEIQEHYISDGRKFDSIEDELSDILLNLLNLARLENIDFTKVAGYNKCDVSDLKLLIPLHGQIAEAVMEQTGYRFKKPRKGFESIEEFIKDRILKMFIIVFNYAMENGINLSYEFDKMYIDAMNFVERKIEEQQELPAKLPEEQFSYGTLRHIRPRV